MIASQTFLITILCRSHKTWSQELILIVENSMNPDLEIYQEVEQAVSQLRSKCII